MKNCTFPGDAALMKYSFGGTHIA